MTIIPRVPAEPSFPVGRIHYMMEEAKVDFVLTDMQFADKLDGLKIHFTDCKICEAAKCRLAAAMVLAAGTTVFAADSELTVNGTTEGKTYDIYKIFDLTKEAGGTGVAYTVDSDWENFFFNGGPGSAYVTTTQTPGLNTLTYKGTTYYINITDSNVAQLAQDALKYAAAKTPDASKTADNSGSVKFTNLDLGYYLVYPKGATDIKDNYASICSLTSTNPSAAVNVKAKYPVIDKEVDNPDVQVGQKVTFTVKGKVPDTTGYTTYKYEIKDTMSSGLTFNSTTANFSVKFGGRPGRPPGAGSPGPPRSPRAASWPPGRPRSPRGSAGRTDP